MMMNSRMNQDYNYRQSVSGFSTQRVNQNQQMQEIANNQEVENLERV